jgi:hypothetical protein
MNKVYDYESNKKKANISIKKIEKAFKKENPTTMSEGLTVVNKVIGVDHAVLPNPNAGHTYIQYVIYPPNGFSYSVGLNLE